ncbi:putative toxin-antitoxin system toxin component, PIN family [Candidatus Gottesmanbacteria bacterium]|nr:putative toxin-antitoxin system toxin component, PIN family [Candidatus Gottesmanbacteria bacterium]
MARSGMKNIFLDSSTVIAASASKTGASAFILGYSRQKKLKTFVSPEVLKEAQKNIRIKIGSLGYKRFLGYIKLGNILVVPSASFEEISLCERYIDKKDAPILAAFLTSPADFIVTLDRKDFLKPQVIKFCQPKIVLTPGEFVKQYLR